MSAGFVGAIKSLFGLPKAKPVPIEEAEAMVGSAALPFLICLTCRRQSDDNVCDTCGNRGEIFVVRDETDRGLVRSRIHAEQR